MRGYFVLTAVVFLFGYTGNVNKKDSGDTYHIPRNFQESVHIGDLFDEYRFVNLEMTDHTSMIGDPKKTLTKDNIIYISDGNRLFWFTTTGRYLNTLNRVGNGPQEYLHITDFLISDDEIYVLDSRKRSIIRYFFDRSFHKSHPFEMWAASFAFLNDAEIVLGAEYMGNEVHKFHILDAQSLETKNSFHEISPAEKTYKHIMNQMNYYHLDDDTLLFHEAMNNSIYKITAGGVEIHCTLNLYGKNPPASFWEKSYTDVMDITFTARDNGYCYGTPNYAESEKQLLFTFQDGNNGYLMCLYDKDSKDAKQFKSIVISPDIPPLPVTELLFTTLTPESIMITIPNELFFDMSGKPYSGDFPTVVYGGNPVVCVASLR